MLDAHRHVYPDEDFHVFTHVLDFKLCKPAAYHLLVCAQQRGLLVTLQPYSQC